MADQEPTLPQRETEKPPPSLRSLMVDRKGEPTSYGELLLEERHRGDGNGDFTPGYPGPDSDPDYWGVR